VKLRITIDGKNYEVDVEVEESEPQLPVHAPYVPAVAPLAPPVAAPRGGTDAAGSDDKVCRSPIAGVIVSINVRESQQVKTDDPLFVLEAMKMETTITSPVDGTVKTLNVAAGESVQPGQVLVEFA
jgi:biotin carboxyl carrier protein